MDGGGQCLGTMECEPGLVCKQMVCTPPGRAGEKCEPSIDMTMVARTSTCGDGLHCVIGGENGAVCAVQAGEGGACERTEGCSGALRCRGGTCVAFAPSKAGEACDESTDCPAGHYCGLMSDTCEPRKADGESCMSNTECMNMCVTGDSVAGNCGPCST